MWVGEGRHRWGWGQLELESPGGAGVGAGGEHPWFIERGILYSNSAANYLRLLHNPLITFPFSQPLCIVWMVFIMSCVPVKIRKSN